MSARLPDSGLTHPCSSRRLLLGAEDLCLPAFVSALYDSLVVGLLSSCLHWLNALLPGQGANAGVGASLARGNAGAAFRAVAVDETREPAGSVVTDRVRDTLRIQIRP